MPAKRPVLVGDALLVPPWDQPRGTHGGVTRLRKEWCVVVTYDRPGADAKKGHGTIDLKQRLYQHGSRNGRAAYKNSMSYGYCDEFQIVQSLCDWIEFIDFEKGEVWRITVKDAAHFGNLHETPNGSRWLVPVDHYTVTHRSAALR